MAHGEWCLRPGEGLKTNEYLRSKNGLFHAVVQGDGNLIVYRGDWWETKEPSAMWAVYGPAADPASDAAYKGWVAENENRIVARDPQHGETKAGPGPSPGQACAVMQADGNFCLYKDVKLGVDSLYARCAWDLWRMKNHQDKGDNHWAVLEDDGEFGFRPNGKDKWIFTSGKHDSIDPKTLALTEMVYDLEHSTITPNGPDKGGAEVIAGPNDSKSEQTVTLILAYTETTATGYKTTTSLSLGSKFTGDIGIPGIAGGKVEVSTTMTQSFEWNKTTTKSVAQTFQLPVKVQPKESVVGKMTWSESSISVPYRFKGTATFKSGKKLPVSVRGIYEGIASHALHANWKSFDPKETQHPAAALKAVDSISVPVLP
jgi:hypothetical protein